MHSFNKFGQNLLVIGCGGGYDIFCGLPIYFKHLSENPNNKCLLANYSFSNSELLKRGERLGSSSVYKIDASLFELPSLSEFVKEISANQEIPSWLLKQMGITSDVCENELGNGTAQNGKLYFPEYELSRELGTYVYAFHGDLGAIGIKEGLKEIIMNNDINTVVAVDGGTDSLMIGNEIIETCVRIRVDNKDQDDTYLRKPGVGTPHEDMVTLSVINALYKELLLTTQSINTYLYILGYNIDLMHGVSDENVQERILELISINAFLGAYHLLNHPESAHSYEKVLANCSPENSWINSLVCASLRGETQQIFLKNRGTSKLPVSPFMAIYFGFDLPSVVSLKYWDMNAIAETTNDEDVSNLIKDVPAYKYLSAQQF